MYLGDAHLYIPTDDKGDFAFNCIADGSLLNAYPDRIIVLNTCKRTPFYYCLKAKEVITNKINASLSDNNAGLLSGMLFGDKSGIDNKIASAFRNSGIAHLLAVSGLHTALWCGMLMSILKLFKVNNSISVVLCLIFLVCFCSISGFTPSVIRASLMTACGMLAPLVKRRADSLNSLGLAVTVLLITNPYTVQSISFQLSAAATVGVLLSAPVTNKIFKRFKDIPIRQLRSVVIYVLSSIVLSLFSGLFTLPVSAYHFGVTTLLSPIANVLCVKPAFYGMLSGTLASLLSFIPTTITKAISFAVFDVTELILDLVSSVAGLISEVRLCTIPVHKQWLLLGIAIGAVILSIGGIIYKTKSKRIVIPITAAGVVLSLFTCILTPLAVPQHKSTLTVLSAGNNLCFVVRCGTHYALLTNTKQALPAELYNYLPKATSESLDLYVTTYLNKSNLYSLEVIGERFSPEETHVTPTIASLCRTQDITPPQNTIVKTHGKYSLSNEITIEIIDTYPGQYAIIRGNKKTAYIHIFGNTAIEEVTDISQADILVYNGSVPDVVQPQVDSIIISGDIELYTNDKMPHLASRCSSLYLTASDGSVQIDL
ncbi:MAG: ComEC/Rec2 family competence protein [Clostridia bacterium]|nr:ComEC/Rec2 family competence protein [Clostridia bacterium]